MKRKRNPTDNSKALAHAARRRPGTIIPSSGHVLVSSSSVADPVCQKLPTRAEIDAMISGDMVDYYRELTANSGSLTAPGVFDKGAVWETAEHFTRTEEQVKAVLRKAGYGRGKATTRSD